MARSGVIDNWNRNLYMGDMNKKVNIKSMTYSQATIHRSYCIVQFNKCTEKDGKPLTENTKKYLLNQVEQVNDHLKNLNEAVLTAQKGTEQDLVLRDRLIVLVIVLLVFVGLVFLISILP